jgi:hypothetical protein
VSDDDLEAKEDAVHMEICLDEANNEISALKTEVLHWRRMYHQLVSSTGPAIESFLHSVPGIGTQCQCQRCLIIRQLCEVYAAAKASSASFEAEDSE